MGTFKKIAEKLRKLVMGYVFYTFPLTLIAFFILPRLVEGHSEKFLMHPHNGYGVILSTLTYIAIYQFMIWIPISLLFSITMFFSRNNRETFIKKLSGIKERDEREVQIAGNALRTSYLSNMTVLLFLLFVSVFYVHYHMMSADNPERGEYPAALNFNIAFPFLDSKTFAIQRKGYDVFFTFWGLPLSKSGLILILLVWQIISFRFVSRRASKVPIKRSCRINS